MCMHINIQVSLEVSLECSKVSQEVSLKMKSFYRVHEKQSLKFGWLFADDCHYTHQLEEIMDTIP